MNREIAKKAKKGMLWTSFQVFSSQGFRFFTSIIIARILYPRDFGLMGMTVIVMGFAERLREFGFYMVLVQTKEITDEHKKTVFTINLIIYLIICFTIYFLADYIGLFFKEPDLAPLLRVSSFMFLISIFHVIPNAILTRNMQFKETSIANIGGQMISFGLPVILALAGLGVWSLLFGKICGNIYTTIIFNLKARWKIRLGISKRHLKEVFSFGIWVNFQTYLRYFLNNMDFIFIGKILGAAQLGYYERAFNLISLPRKRLRDIVEKVLFSAYARIQDDNVQIVKTTYKVHKIVSFISFQLFITLFTMAPSMIFGLYGPKWELTIVPLQIMCLSGLFLVIAMIFEPIYLAKGIVRLRAFLYFLYLIVLIVCVYIGLNWGIIGVSWGVVAASLIYLILSFIFLKRKLNFQIKIFLKHYFLATKYTLIMFMLMNLIKYSVGLLVSEYSLVMFFSLLGSSILGFVLAIRVIKNEEINEMIMEQWTFIKKNQESRLFKFIVKLLGIKPA